MKKKYFLSAAGIALAMAFTFSCTADNGDGGGGSSSSGGGQGYTLTVTDNRNGLFTDIIREPAKEIYEPGEQVILTATSMPSIVPVDFDFDKWTGDTTTTSNPLTITMNKNWNLVANYRSSSIARPCDGFVEGTEREHRGMLKKQFCDERDGRKYVYVEIGEQTWMAENLTYGAPGSIFIPVDPAPGCQEMCISSWGGYYNWATAMDLPESCNSEDCSGLIATNCAPATNCLNQHRKGICPYGWHLPSIEDWDVLTDNIEAEKLKTNSGWNDSSGGNGTDDYGFSALPVGFFSQDSSFSHYGDHGYWWSSSQRYSTGAHVLRIPYIPKDIPTGSNPSKSNFYSVRCVKD